MAPVLHDLLACPADVVALRRRLSVGWNTWDTTGVLTQVLLPFGLALRLGIKEYYRGRTLWDPQIGGKGESDPRVTFEEHSVLGGYSAVVVEWCGITVRVRSASNGDTMTILVEPVELTHQAAIVAEVSYLWNLPGTVSRSGSVVRAEHDGATSTVSTTGSTLDDPYVGARGPYLVVPLDGPVGFTVGDPHDLDEVRENVDAAGHAMASDLARRFPDERHRVHAGIVRDAVGWNTIYEPVAQRVITTVSRGWNVGKRGGFGMFCWDAFFNAALAALHSRDLAHANVIEMLAEVTPAGFVPNVSQGTGRKTFDGSQPPIGALVARELYERFGDRWFLEATIDVLLSWNRWWWQVRRTGPLLSLGSTVFTPDRPSPQDIPRIGQHFGATCESGCDDHPVFADVPFDTTTGLLRSHDIGLNAEYVADCEALAAIADVLGRDDAAVEVRGRGRSVAAALEESLWDEKTGVYRSHFSDTGRPTASLSPMSFYPLIAGLGRGERSARMTALLDDEHTFGGDWVLPSSPRSDPASVEQSYWRGRAWPPVNFLVYLGLARAGQHKHATRLADRSEALVLQEWRQHRHVHENYSSVTGEGCDVANSEPFYSWGALLSLIVLVDSGAIDLFSGWARHQGA